MEEKWMKHEIQILTDFIKRMDKALPSVCALSSQVGPTTQNSVSLRWVASIKVLEPSSAASLDVTLEETWTGNKSENGADSSLGNLIGDLDVPTITSVLGQILTYATFS